MNHFRGLINTHAADRWETAYPTGNGSIGALVHGRSQDETIIFNHERLFLPLPVNRTAEIPPMAAELPEIRRLIKEGRYREATEYFIRRMTEQGFPEELVWTDPFHPAFDLRLRFPDLGPQSEYERRLDFESGEVSVRFRTEQGVHLRRTFVSRPHGVAVVNLRMPEGGAQTCAIELAERPGKRHVGKEVVWVDGEIAHLRAAYEAEEGGYEAAARIIAAPAGVETTAHGFRVSGAEEITLLVSLGPAEDSPQRGESSLADSLAARLAEIDDDYGELLAAHRAEHAGLFDRLRLDLAGGSDRTRSNEALLREAGRRKIPNALIERLHDYGRYLLISSSGELPPNLQGVWNGSWTPPWSSDYTLDENLQMMMWQVLPGRLPELAESYFDLLESYLEDWATNAERYYGCRGVFAGIRSSRDGLHRHFSLDFPLVFWTAGAGWLAQLFYDYYLFTGDREFLRKRAVPFMERVAEFYEDFLQVDESGRYEFVPSYSPENTPANSDNSASRNATMDVAVARELLSNLCAAYELLELPAERAARWREIIAKLPPYLVNEDGALKEWCDPALEDNYHHRHSSHLYPVFPGLELTADSDPRLFEASRRAVELRLAEGVEAISGWGLVHLANISARLGNADLADAALSRLIRVFVIENLFTTHNKHEIFQMDANLGFTAAIEELLVSSRPGQIALLPALPKRFARGSIEGIACRGGIIVEQLEWDLTERRVAVGLTSRREQQVELLLPAEIESSRVDGAAPPAGDARARRLAVRLRAEGQTAIELRLAG